MEREPLRELTLGRRTVSTTPLPVPAAWSFPAGFRHGRARPHRGPVPGEVRGLRWQVECHRRVWEGVESPLEDAAIDAEMAAWAGR